MTRILLPLVAAVWLLLTPVGSAAAQNVRHLKAGTAGTAGKKNSLGLLRSAPRGRRLALRLDTRLRKLAGRRLPSQRYGGQRSSTEVRLSRRDRQRALEARDERRRRELTRQREERIKATDDLKRKKKKQRGY